MMKHCGFGILAVFLFPGLVLGQAQYKVIWTFAGGVNDGAVPAGSLVLGDQDKLYGTTVGGGTSSAGVCSFGGCGTVFELSPNPDGTWSEKILYNFCSDFNNFQCQDGAYPHSTLIVDSLGNLYGTTAEGGNQYCGFNGGGCGTVFELNAPKSPGENWTETILYNFCSVTNDGGCLDGATPNGDLTLDSAGNLYGTTQTGGTGGSSGFCCVGGTVFTLTHGDNRWTESVLYNFCPTGGRKCPDGVGPQAGVTIDAAGNLYGTTELGGTPQFEGGGTVYELTPSPTGWTHSVLVAPRSPFPLGCCPMGKVSLDAAGRIYSTFSGAGQSNAGSVFEFAPSGQHTQFLFDGSNGRAPKAGILLDSGHGALYGTTSGNADGNVYKISKLKQETVLYRFCSQGGCTDGRNPVAGLIFNKSRKLYGTAANGGNDDCGFGSGCGVVFEITP